MDRGLRRNLLYRTFHLIELVETRSAEPPSLQAICPDREMASLNRTPCCQEPPLKGQQGAAPCTGLSAPKAQSHPCGAGGASKAHHWFQLRVGQGILISITVGSTCGRHAPKLGTVEGDANRKDFNSATTFVTSIARTLLEN